RFTSAGWAKQNRDFFSYVKCSFDRKIVPLFYNINRKHTHFPHYFLFEPSLIWRPLHQFNQNTAVKPTMTILMTQNDAVLTSPASTAKEIASRNDSAC